MAKPPTLFDEEPSRTGKRTQSGIATSDVVLSAHIDDNTVVFPQVLALHVPVGSHVADITYGTGVFWRNVSEADYVLHKSDLKLGVDFSSLPYPDHSMDAVILDPPYMEGLYRKPRFSRTCFSNISSAT